MSGPPPSEDNEANEPKEPSSSVLRTLRRAEEVFNLAILAFMAALPLFEMVARPLIGAAVPGSAQYISMLTLWIGFTGGMLAARDNRHLSLSTGVALLRGKLRVIANVTSVLTAVVVVATLAKGSFEVVSVEMKSTQIIPGGVPIWVTQVIMPIGYAVIALRTAFVGVRTWRQRIPVVVAAAAILFVVNGLEAETAEVLLAPGLVLLVISTALGSPIFVALGGAALLFFWADETPIAAVCAETLRLTEFPTMPTIPLFTFAGYVLAESQSSTRLVRATKAIVGWMPGGVAIMTTLVCAFFTTFTGASGVTILALGGLLLPMLLKERYPERFSVGLLTASGSIGLLFPPALPVIFYGVVAKIPVHHMFVAGVLPGVVLVGAVAAFGAYVGVKNETGRVAFDSKEALEAVNQAKWELATPAIVLGSILFGIATVTEAAAITAVYALFIEIVVYKDLRIRDLVRVGRECATLIGGVLIILGVALGLTNYLVDAEVPASALEWIQSGISSKYVFLAVLNIFLLVVGCLMDIFSAIAVVVPLVLPISAYFGIHPIHLGVIFLANLELGFLTPPVGMNLFLSSYRFKQPLVEVYRAAIPFLIIMIIAVLLITYIPALTLTPVEWIFGAEALEVAPPSL